MVNLNVGSIADIVYSGISPFPSAISGVLTSLVNTNIFFIENQTGDTIGSLVANKYQPALVNLTTANVIRLMAVQDLGINQVAVGDLNTNNNNLMALSKQFEEIGMLELTSITKGLKYYKARG